MNSFEPMPIMVLLHTKSEKAMEVPATVVEVAAGKKE